jgi:hypothetical protein
MILVKRPMPARCHYMYMIVITSNHKNRGEPLRSIMLNGECHRSTAELAPCKDSLSLFIYTQAKEKN